MRSASFTMIVAAQSDCDAPKPGISHVYFEACLHDDRCCTPSRQASEHARLYLPALLLLAPDEEGCEMSARSLVDKAAEFYSARRGFESYRARHL